MANGKVIDTVVDIDGRQLCVNRGAGNATCTQSQLALTLAVLAGQIVGTGLAVAYPIVYAAAAGWVSAASHLLMTLSIAASLALASQASTLVLLRGQLSVQQIDDTFALYVLMTVVSVLMWLTPWLFQGWMDSQSSVTTTEEKRTKG